jgi:hypothetical protein
VSFAVLSEGGNYRFSYGIVLTTDTFIKPGDFFTIYDFAGFVPGSNSQPDGWVFSASNTGKTPGNTDPADDPGVPNLTWVYQGAQVDGQQGLGNFMASSSYASYQFDSFTARTNRIVDGRIDSNITDTQVPVPGPGPGPGPATPEPATLALAGLGLPLLGLARALRRRRA